MYGLCKNAVSNSNYIAGLAKLNKEPHKIIFRSLGVADLEGVAHMYRYGPSMQRMFFVYVRVLISLWRFLFPICSTSKRIFLGWVKEVRTTK
jgi:hypothetical protein